MNDVKHKELFNQGRKGSSAWPSQCLLEVITEAFQLAGNIIMELVQQFKNYLMQALFIPFIVLSEHANTSTIQTRVLSTLRSLTMHIVLVALAIIATFTSPARAQNAATNIAKDAAQASKTARLSIDALCAQLTLDEVTAIVGKNFERRPEKEKLYQSCTYGDSKEKGQLRVRYFSLSSSILKEASWRKFVESDAKRQDH